LDTSADTLVTDTTKTPTINAGKTGKLNIPITELSSALDGSYYLIVETVDSSSNTASAASSSTVEIAPPFVTLTETLTTTLPAALVSDSSAKGSVILAITNSGNVPSKGVTPITVTTSTTSGVVGTTIATVTPPKNLNILPGKTVKVTIPSKNIPSSDGLEQYPVESDVGRAVLFDGDIRRRKRRHRAGDQHHNIYALI
jgi:hypothetical protein